MNTKHTKGQWEMKPSRGNNTYEYMVICPDSFTIICEMEAQSAQHIEETKANAKLIASAPELLKALNKILSMNLQEARDRTGNPDDAENWACVRVAREAISKATL